MAIEFHCPYCTAAIRVADSSAGKRGTCPKCAQKVMVPQPAETAGVSQTLSARATGSRGNVNAGAEAAAPEESSPDAPPKRPEWFTPAGKPKGKAAEPRRGMEDAAAPADPISSPPHGAPIDQPEEEDRAGNGEPALPVAQPVDETPLPMARPVEELPVGRPVSSEPAAAEDEAVDEFPPFLAGDSPAVDEPVAFVLKDGERLARPLPAAPAASATYARKLKRRTRRKQSVPWMPVVCIVLLLGVLGGFAWWGQGGPGGGALTAEPLEDFLVPDATVDTGRLELPQATITTVLDELRESPRSLRSKYMWTEFRGSQRGLRVRLAEGDETMFYRVNVADHSGLRKYAAENSARLGEPRQKELDESAVRFFKEWEAAPSIEAAVTDLRGYRDTLGLPALVGPLGYHAVVEHEGLLYRCVYEDPEGNLYFLLPEGMTEFTLRGRQLANGDRPFTKSYPVTVAGGAGRAAGG